MQPGEKLKVDDAAGKHLLNAFTPRGLSSLEFGDKEEEVAADGLRRNMEFKKRMVMQHNHRNVVRKQQGLAYTEPTPYILQAAQALGIELDQPYAPRDKENSELLSLRAQVAELTALVNRLLDGGASAPPKKGKVT